MLPAHICFASSAHINALLVDELGMNSDGGGRYADSAFAHVRSRVGCPVRGTALDHVGGWMLAAPMVAALTRLDALRRSFRAMDLAALGLWALGVDLGVLLAGFALPPGS